MADTQFPAPPPPQVPQGWDPRWSPEYKTWFYVNNLTGQSTWEPPTQPVYASGSGAPPSGPPPPNQEALQGTYTPAPTPGSEPGAVAWGPPGADNPGFPSPPAEGSDGERGLFGFGSSGPNGNKQPGLMGKVALGVGAVALIGGAVHEFDKHFGGKSNQQAPPPPAQDSGNKWWSPPQIPGFGPGQQQGGGGGGSGGGLFLGLASFASGGIGGGGGADITAEGACSSGPEQVHNFSGSWWYNVSFNEPVTSTTQQVNWHMCRKCLVMNWTGNGTGPCAGGGRHDNHGSLNYRLDAGPNGQKNWRFCNKCHSLGFNGSNDIGKCPGGGVHDHYGSWDFGLLHDNEGGQNRWKWCNKCQQLVFDGWH